MIAAAHSMYNGSSAPVSAIPELPLDRFLETIMDATGHGWRVIAYFGLPRGVATPLYCLLAEDAEGRLAAMRTVCEGDCLPSLTPACPQLHLFEREIAEQCGLAIEGHPWFKPVRFHRSWVPGRDAWQRPADDPLTVGVMEFFQVAGDEVHEVAVGPVHAGIIEPGHFRFQCHGEEVFHLEISLGFQHRGIERRLIGGPDLKTLRQMEVVAGDTTIGHALAHCMLMETLGQVKVPPRAQVLRGIALELERLANHTGDIGAIAGDTGYLPTASFCGRIRGDILNMTAVLCGSRFGRGVVTPGGTVFDLDAARCDDLLKRLQAVRRDLTDAVELMRSTPSVMARLEGTGTVSREVALELGLVGPAARASGLKRDVRVDHPFGIYRMTHLPLATGFHGDVCARAAVRWQEAEKSLDFVEEQLQQIPTGGHRTDSCPLAANQLAVALTEGWRGEVCHVVLTDDQGRFVRYKIVDPSFHNWQGLAMALRGQQISDFPLCNKSFNLSYCGSDL